jgi:3-dehydroquinate dehydratase-2
VGARRLYVLNGPNLNLLGQREPQLYGTSTLADVQAACERVATELGFDLFFAQSNAEHQLVDWVQDAFRESAAVVINPAGLSFRSVPLLDALLMLSTPIVEIHITNIHARDAAHSTSLVSPAATAVIAGAGVFGYELAIRAVHALSPAQGEASR